MNSFCIYPVAAARLVVLQYRDYWRQ